MQENNIVITTDSKNEAIIDNDKKSYNYFLYQERIKLNLKSILILEFLLKITDNI